MVKNDNILTNVTERQGLQYLIIDNLLNGNLKAYDINTDELLDSIEIFEILHETVGVFDYEFGYIGTDKRLKYNEMRIFRITQEWQISKENLIHNKIVSIVIFEVGDLDELIPLVKLKFDNKFIKEKIINVEKNAFIVEGREVVDKKMFNIHENFSKHMLNTAISKYECKSGMNKNSCQEINDENLIHEILNRTNCYVINQYFYFDIENYSINSQYITLSCCGTRYDEKNNFMYYDDPELYLKN